MKTTLTFFILLLIICFFIPAANAGTPPTDKSAITWSGWNNYPNSNIFYRIQVLDPKDSGTETVAIEILNNYKKDVSFCIALNDDGLKAIFTPVANLRKNHSTIVNYPKPKDTFQMFASITSIQLN